MKQNKVKENHLNGLEGHCNTYLLNCEFDVLV